MLSSNYMSFHEISNVSDRLQVIILCSGPATAMRQAQGLQPVAQVRGAVHADLPAVPGYLPLDRCDPCSVV